MFHYGGQETRSLACTAQLRGYRMRGSHVRNRLMSEISQNFRLLALGVTPMEKELFPRRDDDCFKIDFRSFRAKTNSLKAIGKCFLEIWRHVRYISASNSKCMRKQFSTPFQQTLPPHWERANQRTNSVTTFYRHESEIFSLLLETGWQRRHVCQPFIVGWSRSVTE